MAAKLVYAPRHGRVFEDAAADVLKTLGENLGWRVDGDETLRCGEVWHRPNARLRRLCGGVLFS